VRFRLIDLIVMVAIEMPTLILADDLLPIGDPRVRFLLAFLMMFLAYFVVSSPLYRWLHSQPLLLPRCPICRDRNRHYRTIHLDWPEEVIECATCHARVLLCLDGRKCGSRRSEPIQFCLKWPYSFGGRWRRVS